LIERAAEKLRGQTPQPATTPSGGSQAAPTSPAAKNLRPQRPVKPSEPREEPNRQQSPPDVEIDLEALAERGMITPRGERTRIAEEFRGIKRPLLIDAFATGDERIEHGNIIMVTSAIPGEGKTFTSVNLAMSIAKERDLYVLLVDADLSRPQIMTALGLDQPGNGSQVKGLADLLEDSSLDVGDVLLRTNIPNLSIIPAGRPHPMGTELLASARSMRAISEIAERYSNRVIIIDTSPVLASSEGSALAQSVGQIVFVVEAERTKESEVAAALEVLVACPHVKLVLNKARTRLGGNITGYYGGYYGSYFGREADD
jgi:receptor protein-tyrosine kinase